jgi:hypothetical protein
MSYEWLVVNSALGITQATLLGQSVGKDTALSFENAFSLSLGTPTCISSACTWIPGAQGLLQDDTPCIWHGV